jgi:hypothetical protein
MSESNLLPAPESPAAFQDWIIANFKPIDSLIVPIRHLSILTGANSSGKSSALQSLLLLVQSLSIGEMVLNGSLVSLGESNDAIRSGETEMVWGCRAVSPTPPDGEHPTMELRTTYVAKQGRLEPVAVDVDLGGVRLLEAERPQGRVPSEVMALTQDDAGGGGGVLQVTMLHGGLDRGMYLEMDGVLPKGVIYEQERAEALQQLAWITRDNLLAHRGARDRLARLMLGTRPGGDVSSAWEAIADSAARTRRQDEDTAFVEQLASRDLESLRADFLQRLLWVVNPLVGRSTKSAISGWHGGISQLAMLDPDAATALDYLALVLSALRGFAMRLVYLGPLREAPQLVSPMGEGSRNAPVGRPTSWPAMRRSELPLSGRIEYLALEDLKTRSRVGCTILASGSP